MRYFDTDFYGRLSGSIRLTCSDEYDQKLLSITNAVSEQFDVQLSEKVADLCVTEPVQSVVNKHLIFNRWLGSKISDETDEDGNVAYRIAFRKNTDRSYGRCPSIDEVRSLFSDLFNKTDRFKLVDAELYFYRGEYNDLPEVTILASQDEESGDVKLIIQNLDNGYIGASFA